MRRTPCCDKNGLKKGPWTPEEDQKLIDYIQKHGYGNWRTLPKNAGLQRCGKSCRLRWTNYLRPDIKRGRFSFEEEETIIQLHSILGNKWSAIAARLPGRTDNEIKNYWNTHIRKRLLRMGIDPITHNPRLDLLDLSSIFNHHTASFFSTMNSNHLQHLLMNNFNFNFNMLGGGLHQQHTVISPEILKLATSLFPTTTTTTANQQQQQQLITSELPTEIPPTPTTVITSSIPSIPFSSSSSSSSTSSSSEIHPSISEQHPNKTTTTQHDQFYNSTNFSNDFHSQQQTTLHPADDHLLIMNSDWDDEPFNTHDFNHGGIYDYDSTLHHHHQEQEQPIIDNIIYNNNPVVSDFGFISSSPTTTPLNSSNSNSTYINGGSSTITHEDIERESYSSSSNNFINFPPHILQHLNNHFIL